MSREHFTMYKCDTCGTVARSQGSSDIPCTGWIEARVENGTYTVAFCPAHGKEIREATARSLALNRGGDLPLPYEERREALEVATEELEELQTAIAVLDHFARAPFTDEQLAHVTRDFLVRLWTVSALSCTAFNEEILRIEGNGILPLWLNKSDPGPLTGFR